MCSLAHKCFAWQLDHRFSPSPCLGKPLENIVRCTGGDDEFIFGPVGAEVWCNIHMCQPNKMCDACSGTLRGQFGLETERNVIGI